MVGSSNANLFASISAGICALWGPLHGGANEACVEMLEQIIADGGNVKKYVNMAKDQTIRFRLMGFGHRVYKNYDPRARIIKAACDKLLAKLEVRDPLFDVAQQLEEVALNDPYLHRAETLSQRRLLLGRHLPRHRDPRADVHGAVRHRTLARLDRPLDRNAQLAQQADLPPAPDLHRPDGTRVCRPQPAVGSF